VGALALQIAWLKGSLHGASPFPKMVKSPHLCGPKLAAQITVFTPGVSTVGDQLVLRSDVDKLPVAR
jgi:hypothetical protein